MKSASVLLLVLLLSTSVMVDGLAPTSPLGANADQIPASSVYMNPFRVEGTAGKSVVVAAKILNVQLLFAFQIGLLFNPAVVECTDASEGGFLSNNNQDPLLAFPGRINNTVGVITPYAWSLTDYTKAKSGGGTLAVFSFRLKVTGYSDLHVSAFDAVDNTGVQKIPVKTTDYYTAVMSGYQFVFKIVGNAQGQEPAGDSGYAGHGVTRTYIKIGSISYFGQFSFDVTGFPVNGNTFAYFNATIPKSLLSCNTSGQWAVLLNDVLQPTRTVAENATHTTISLQFTYSQTKPLHTVKILSTSLHLRRYMRLAWLKRV